MRLIIRDYKHWRFKYELMRFGVLLLVVMLFWIGIELYSTYISTELEDDYSVQIEPLNPALDLEILDQLSRRNDAPSEFSIVLPESTSAPTAPKQTPQPTSRPRAASSSALTATSSGELE